MLFLDNGPPYVGQQLLLRRCGVRFHDGPGRAAASSEAKLRRVERRVESGAEWSCECSNQ